MGWAQDGTLRNGKTQQRALLCSIYILPVSTNDFGRPLRTLEPVNNFHPKTGMLRDMHCEKVNLPVQMMCWREVNWSGVYWYDAGKKGWETKPRWGNEGEMRKHEEVEWKDWTSFWDSKLEKTKMIFEFVVCVPEEAMVPLPRCKKQIMLGDKGGDLSLYMQNLRGLWGIKGGKMTYQFIPWTHLLNTCFMPDSGKVLMSKIGTVLALNKFQSRRADRN